MMTNGEFHTVKNWYQFLTAREKLVPIRHTFRTNVSHFVNNTHKVKFHLAFLRIPHIDKTAPQISCICIRFQFFTFLSLTSVTVKYQSFTSVITWYQWFKRVRV